jgi:IclR family pca regulon transcriptional regulator
MGRVLLAGLPPGEAVDLRRHELRPVQPTTITDPELLLAELKKIREEGFALVDQELEPGLITVAVPIRDRTGRVRAAIDIATHTGRRSATQLRDLVPLLQAAAERIEQGLSHSMNWAA